MPPFVHYRLRTTDVAAAQTFYAAVLGGVALDIVSLPAAAAARGAPAHWLGLIATDDVAATVRRFVERGAAPLGPVDDDLATIRDPGGAVVGFARMPIRATPVGLHVLHSDASEAAAAAYHDVLGWHRREPLIVGNGVAYAQFGCDAHGPPAGLIGPTRPGIHPHWLFAFVVASIEEATNAVRIGGGTVYDSSEFATASPLTICEDPQGAAFALCES